MPRKAMCIVPLLMALLSATDAEARPRTAPPGQAKFMLYGCWQCHGTQATGGLGPPLARGLDEDAIAAMVRAGAGPMPAYSVRFLPDPDLHAIVSYIRSRPAPQSSNDIPALRR